MLLTLAAAALVFQWPGRHESRASQQEGGAQAPTDSRELPVLDEARLASAKIHQIDVTFPPGTRHARMEEALSDGELRLQPPGGTALTGARFVTVTYSTVSGRAERSGAILRHAWGVTLDTEREIAYVFDSKYERDASAVIAHLASELGAGGLDVRRYAVHDLTMEDGQVEGTCTRWTVALNALIVAGVIDETVTRHEVFSALSDEIVGDALETVGFDVSSDRGYEALVETLRPVLTRPHGERT